LKFLSFRSERERWIFVFPMCLATACSIIVWFAFLRTCPYAELNSKLAIGMSREQVEQILGPPTEYPADWFVPSAMPEDRRQGITQENWYCDYHKIWIQVGFWHERAESIMASEKRKEEWRLEEVQLAILRFAGVVLLVLILGALCRKMFAGPNSAKRTQTFLSLLRPAT